MKVVTLNAQRREPRGTGEARRVRHAGNIPAVVYGEGGSPSHITVETKSFRHAVEHGARVIDLDFDESEATRVLVKDLQYDALGAKLLHADFLRLSPDHEIELAIPLDFRGTPKGVHEGGVLTVLSSTVAVRCLPRHIPEGIEIDVSDMGMADTLMSGEIQLPENVALAAEPDKVVLSITVPRGLKEDEEESEEGEVGEEGAEAASDDDAGGDSEGDG